MIQMLNYPFSLGTYLQLVLELSATSQDDSRAVTLVIRDEKLGRKLRHLGVWGEEGMGNMYGETVKTRVKLLQECESTQTRFSATTPFDMDSMRHQSLSPRTIRFTIGSQQRFSDRR